MGQENIEEHGSFKKFNGGKVGGTCAWMGTAWAAENL
jgi:hypothetical protein